MRWDKGLKTLYVTCRTRKGEEISGNLVSIEGVDVSDIITLAQETLNEAIDEEIATPGVFMNLLAQLHPQSNSESTTVELEDVRTHDIDEHEIQFVASEEHCDRAEDKKEAENDEEEEEEHSDAPSSQKNGEEQEVGATSTVTTIAFKGVLLLARELGLSLAEMDQCFQKAGGKLLERSQREDSIGDSEPERGPKQCAQQ